MTLKHINEVNFKKNIFSYKFKKLNEIFRDESCENQKIMTLCTLVIYSIDQICSIIVFRETV